MPVSEVKGNGAPPAQTVATGFVVAVVGFFGSFPIVLQGLHAVGANDSQAASGLMAAALAMGLTGILISLYRREPISVAWSTPGVAFLAVSGQGEIGFAGAVAGFLIAGVLTMIAGMWRPLSQLAASIPAPLAQAMLAGVLLPLCIAPFMAIADVPQFALPIILTWFVVGRFSRLFAVPAAVLAAGTIILLNPTADFVVGAALTQFELTMPQFSMQAALGIGLPLFIITMATQNIPGIAILKSCGYQPMPGPLITSVGTASALTSILGAPATCLAAITAAMCANDDSHPDPHRRYWSAVLAGSFYCLFGLFAGVITSFASLAPAQVLQTLVGVALLATFANATAAAFASTESREAVAVTFLVTSSGLSLLGLSAAVWGLVIGSVIYWITRAR